MVRVEQKDCTFLKGCTAIDERLADPLSGHLFLFVNRNPDRMKILSWDRDGFCIWTKRLERGTFQLLTTTNDDEGIELDYFQLVKLLGGLDLRTGRRRKRYHRMG